MDERLIARLAARLADGTIVLASVLATRGATPRKRGARMLVDARGSEFSVGGGAAEARVVAAARALLYAGHRDAEIRIDLRGGEGADGVCGGEMRIALKRWQGEADRAVARAIADTLARGESAVLPGAMIGADAEDATLLPDVRLVIAGAGHCGHALATLARPLDFEVFVHDARAECFESVDWGEATTLCGPAARLVEALRTPRRVFAVLLSRDFPSDVAALEALSESPPEFIGMMGSRKRIKHVRAALSPRAAALSITAPVGLDIGEETPHEIAVAILAQLVQQRRAG